MDAEQAELNLAVPVQDRRRLFDAVIETLVRLELPRVWERVAISLIPKKVFSALISKMRDDR